MTKETIKRITQKLKQGGHSEERIKEIHEEAKNFSQPEYIYQYWGYRGKFDYIQ